MLGLPILEERQPADGEGAVLAQEPRVTGNAKPHEAIYDFLSGWLVEQKPEEVIAYFGDEALTCMEIERGKPVDRGMARYAMLMGLQEVNEKLGKPA